MTGAPSYPDSTSGLLTKAGDAFEFIRLKLINCLNEPERSAFWKAVEMRDLLRPVCLRKPPSIVAEDDIKLVYVKRWRTLVKLPAKYADEIVEALRGDAQPPANCDCGFTAEVCKTNPCMRKKMATSGLNPEAKYPYCGTALIRVEIGKVKAEVERHGWKQPSAAWYKAFGEIAGLFRAIAVLDGDAQPFSTPVKCDCGRKIENPCDCAKSGVHPSLSPRLSDREGYYAAADSAQRPMDRDEIAKRIAFAHLGDDREWKGFRSHADRFLAYALPSTSRATPEDRKAKNEREMAEGTRCNGLCKDGGQCNC